MVKWCSLTEGLFFTIVELFGILAVLIQIPEYQYIAKGILAALSYTCIGFSMIFAMHMESCYIIPYAILVSSLTSYLFTKRGKRDIKTVDGFLTISTLMVAICLLVSDQRGKSLLVPVLLWISCLVVKRIAQSIPRNRIARPDS